MDSPRLKVGGAEDQPRAGLPELGLPLWPQEPLDAAWRERGLCHGSRAVGRRVLSPGGWQERKPQIRPLGVIDWGPGSANPFTLTLVSARSFRACGTSGPRPAYPLTDVSLWRLRLTGGQAMPLGLLGPFLKEQ